jgi:hypothetical protein
MSVFLSLLKRFTYMSMLGTTRFTTTPSRCTSTGKRFRIWAMRVFTFTTACSGSVPRLNTIWMLASPALTASEVMYFMPGTPLMACSSGMSTDSVSTLALAPG